MSKKVGRNDFCPCGSGRKFKHCCLGRLDWERVQEQGHDAIVRHLSIRGRNIGFINAMAGILQLDSLTIPDWRNFKKAFTPKAVRDIHEAVIRMWPPDTDLSLALQPDPAEVRALYVGDYEPELLARGVTRHCLYADKMTLVDPFVYSIGIKPEYNPLEYPEHYRSAAIRCARMWFQFIEWIDQGLVEFIRTPGDLDRRALNHPKNSRG